MSLRQERKSCEACRTRKLRCSGEKSGCSRCRALAMPCRFKDKGAPGRPRKRMRPEQRDSESPTGGNQADFSSPSHFPSVLQPALLGPQETASMLMGPGEFNSSPCDMPGACGFDSFQLEILGNGDISSFPLESWQPSRQNPEIPPLASDAYVSPTSFSQSCKCDEEVTGIVRDLSRAKMSHDVIQTLRTGISLTERLLTCPLCYDVSKPPRVTVQNVLLIGHLMFEVTSGYQKYLRWLEKSCAELDTRNGSETVYLDSGIGVPSGLNLQISGEKFRDLVIHGLQVDVERMSALGKKFAQRQRNRHMVGHEACPGPEGHCRKKEDGFDHDPLDICPQDPVARKLVPCFRIVDEVRGMISQVVDAVA